MLVKDKAAALLTASVTMDLFTGQSIRKVMNRIESTAELKDSLIGIPETINLMTGGHCISRGKYIKVNERLLPC